ncbi:YlbD family protein [Bacillus timonensis]|nr:YlbD family protein [Bacillus timonensis]
MMSSQNQHPSIQKFKHFVKRHPKLTKEVRAGRKTWQEFYEDWYLLGETDDVWDQYKEIDKSEQAQSEDSSISSKGDFMSKIFTTIKNVDINEVQQQISNVGSAISTIQSVIQQFQGSSHQNSNETNQRPHPFSFRKD